MNTTYTFKPVYGYGWRCGDNSIEVPGEFVLNAHTGSESEIVGEIVGSHEFTNKKAILSLRSSADGTKHYNVIIKAESGEDVTGFAELVGEGNGV